MLPRHRVEKNNGFLDCARGHFQTSVTSGTIFDRPRTPLPLWFRAIGWVVTRKNGASALGLQRILGLGSHETAWTWLHNIRHAMVTPFRAELDGAVEVDETFLGGLEEGVSGRETFQNAMVVIAAEVDGTRIGRIRMRRIPDASEASLLGVIAESIVPGSLVHTDGWLGYKNLAENGYGHKVTAVKHSGQEAHDVLPRGHRVVSLLKRWSWVSP